MIKDWIDVLVVEDSEPFRRGLRALLKSAPDMRLAGEAINGVEAIAFAERLQPDVVLMDLHLPDVNGIEATRRIVRTSPHIAILVLTMFDDDDSVFAAMQAGARGYLLKGALKNEIVHAVRGVVAGEAIFGPPIAQRMISYFSRIRPNLSNSFTDLTEREREVLALIAQHQSNVEIAHRLGISAKTVRNHASNIFAKLQVVDRAQAIIKARDAGLGKNQFP